MRQHVLYGRIEGAAEAQKLDAAGVEALSADAVKAMAGVAGESVSATALANMRRSVAAGLRQKEMAAAAAWIEGQVRARFAKAEAAFRRDGLVEVWLDGRPKEVE